MFGIRFPIKCIRLYLSKIYRRVVLIVFMCVCITLACFVCLLQWLCYEYIIYIYCVQFQNSSFFFYKNMDSTGLCFIWMCVYVWEVTTVWQYGHSRMVFAQISHNMKWLHGTSVTVRAFSSHFIHFVAVSRYNTFSTSSKSDRSFACNDYKIKY